MDNEPKEVRLPILLPKTNASALRSNYINDQCRETHDVDIVGWLTTTVCLESGLDRDHEKCVHSPL